MRGGSWNNNPRNCRSAIRNNNHPGERNNNNGFRVVCRAASTLLYQGWQMGICWVSRRRVQPCSGDVGDGIQKSTRSVSLVSHAEPLPDHPHS
ncbi:hypothetical protein ACN4EK_26020 [Pantanalinema rosaneae CENA516]|uniref:hypothetical protein n=1 Tax=Pantanalinema rosaneae TaxID=1620701 RepID=UPI003D6E0BDB